MALYFGNSGKQKIIFNGEQYRVLMGIVNSPVSSIYDDTFPIEWNTVAVANGENVKVTSDDGFTLVKVSNLTPTSEQMQEIAMIANIQGNDVSLTPIYTQAFDYGFFVVYGDLSSGIQAYVINQSSSIFPETGMYVSDFYANAELIADFSIEIMSVYLYGTQQNGGNIGLRVGDTTTYYKGVALPGVDAIWKDKTKYPYIVISAAVNGDEIVAHMYLCANPVHISDTGSSFDIPEGGYIKYMYTNSQTVVDKLPMLVLNAWVELFSGDNMSNWDLDDIMWANHDILNADGSVKYNGAVLPNIDEVWTDKTTYPYAWIADATAFNGMTLLYLSSTIPTYSGDSNNGLVYAKNAKFAMYVSDGIAWEFGEEGDYTNTNDLVGTTVAIVPLVWANTDIINEEDNTTYLAASEPVKSSSVYLAASEPIPVSGLVGCSYNGVELPALPEWDKDKYPHAAICVQINSDAGTLYSLFAINGGTYITADDAKHFKSSEEIQYCGWFLATTEVYAEAFGIPIGVWSLADEGTEEAGKQLAIESPLWTNYDLLYEDGSVYLAASSATSIYNAV